jgi:hypothetical protein
MRNARDEGKYSGGKLDDRLRTLEELEAQLEHEPDSEGLRQQLLVAYAGPLLANHSRRAEHIVEYVRRFPRTEAARCGLVRVDPEASATAFRQVEGEWLRHSEERFDDPEIARGFALFVAAASPERAYRILRAALVARPGDPALWADMGRVCQAPLERLLYLREAKRLGASQATLLVWIARTALDVEDLVTAEQSAREMLGLVQKARALHGDRLDWLDRGHALWLRARAAAGADGRARGLVSAIQHHALRKHAAHTTLGVLAAWRGDLPSACQHLRDSATVGAGVGPPSPGSSFRLARELCQRGEWNTVVDYLSACEHVWESERLHAWSLAAAGRTTPEFPRD